MSGGYGRLTVDEAAEERRCICEADGLDAAAVEAAVRHTLEQAWLASE